MKLLSHSSNIQFINNPSEKLQIRAITAEEPSWAVTYIKNPCKKVINYIKKYDKINTNEDTQLKAVINNGLNLKYISHYEYCNQGDEFKINEKVELVALKQHIKAIKYCNIFTMGQKTIDYINSSEYLQIKAVKECEYFIHNIDKPSKKVQIAAVKSAEEPESIVLMFINEKDLCKKLKRKYY